MAQIDQRLAELSNEQKYLIERKNSLQAALAENTATPPNTLTSLQKIKIFTARFKGRPDVFAQRWQNTKGRSGYSVACHNEWVKGLCKKSKIKCNECSNRKFKELDDHTIYDHLSGKQVVGLYPLLPENNCHLLAIDFDKEDWQPAIKAMTLACQKFDIPHAVEISRSGNGAHLWIFFSELIPAKEARQLGFSLLDKAMEIHPDLSFDSYDRLFPNQDLMPDGGFGNLIALPLQYQARQQGNSLFVDVQLRPYPDQWSFLSQLKNLSAQQLKGLLIQLDPQSQLAIDTRPPWEQGAKVKHEKIEHFPKAVTLVLANHIYLKMNQLPSPLIARLKRLASFSNPIFFKTQAMHTGTGCPTVDCLAIPATLASRWMPGLFPEHRD